MLYSRRLDVECDLRMKFASFYTRRFQSASQIFEITTIIAITTISKIAAILEIFTIAQCVAKVENFFLRITSLI